MIGVDVEEGRSMWKFEFGLRKRSTSEAGRASLLLPPSFTPSVFVFTFPSPIYRNAAVM